jgi:hypothetical protein
MGDEGPQGSAGPRKGVPEGGNGSSVDAGGGRSSSSSDPRAARIAAAKATALGETFWAKVARTNFLPVEDEPLEPGEGFWDKAGAFFYNLGLKTRSVDGSFTRFRCSNSSCLASYFVEDSLLHSTFQCPSCRHETATPMIELQNDLMKFADEAAKARQSRE